MFQVPISLANFWDSKQQGRWNERKMKLWLCGEGSSDASELLHAGDNITRCVIKIDIRAINMLCESLYGMTIDDQSDWLISGNGVCPPQEGG